MFIEDIQTDFYKVIKGKHVLVFINYDIDAICACKIFQYLFRADSTPYTSVPVQGVQDLVEGYKRHAEQVKYVLLINCGGTIDVVDTLQPEEDVVIFIVDSHKPTDVCNIYSRSQVRLIGNVDENVPKFEDIFMDSESEDDENESEEAALNKRLKKNWEENRNRLLFEYAQFSYHGRSTALVAFEIVWKLGKDSLESLWCALVGFTYQILLGLVLDDNYLDELPVLQLHLTRLMPQIDDRCRSEQIKITFQKDLKLVLYRHWTVQASLRHSLNTAVKLHMWSLRGEKRLYQLLAEIGMPLSESKQNFCSMDVELRQNFVSMMEKIAGNYDLSIIFPSFTINLGFSQTYQSADYVYSMMSLLSVALNEKSQEECFLLALDCLSKNKLKILNQGMDNSKRLFIAIMRQVQNLLDMKQIMSAGPFLYFVLEEGSTDSKLFSCPSSLGLLARYALQAYTSISRSRKVQMLPLIASSSATGDTCLILGIPPASEAIPRNFFGKAFDQAIESIQAEPVTNFFDTSIIIINKQDRPKFFDALISILS